MKGGKKGPGRGEGAPVVIGLMGNPNVGKSTLFNRLTGLNQHTGNWPGKTVELAAGRCTLGGRNWQLVDLPGTYSLLAHSPEEEVARDFIQSGQAAALLVLCDAGCLERNLNLALQALALTGRVAIGVNLMDEARKKGITVDVKALSRELGVPVVGISARQGEGIEKLLRALDAAMALDPAPRYPQFASGQPGELVAASYREAERLARLCVSGAGEEAGQRQLRLDRILTSRRAGIPLMLALLAGALFITITGANYPSALLMQALFALEDWLGGLVLALGGPAWLHGAFVQGAFRVLAWVISVMLPPMAIFFPLFTLLEDVGYLPRVAFNLDHCLRRCSACGKQALTMCMGLGCNAAGVTGCRIIDSPRERLIAILTNSFMPCNGRFPTMISIISMFFVGQAGGLAGSLLGALLLTAVVGLGIGCTFFVSWALSKTLLRGTPSSFTLEMPPFRKPQVGQVLLRSLLDRTLFVLGRAAAVAAPAGLCIWLLANITLGGETLLAQIAGALDPLGRFLGMDGVILLGFILGLPANEIVIPIIIMAYLQTGSLQELESLAALRQLLVANGWTSTTALCTLLFSLLHWPCSTTLLTIRKEAGGWKWAGLAFLLPTALGMALCSLVAAIA